MYSYQKYDMCVETKDISLPFFSVLSETQLLKKIETPQTLLEASASFCLRLATCLINRRPRDNHVIVLLTFTRKAISVLLYRSIEKYNYFMAQLKTCNV